MKKETREWVYVIFNLILGIGTVLLDWDSIIVGIVYVIGLWFIAKLGKEFLWGNVCITIGLFAYAISPAVFNLPRNEIFPSTWFPAIGNFVAIGNLMSELHGGIRKER